MPHFIVEHSANIDEAQLDLPGLFEKLHNAALATGLFPLGGIRSRAHPCDTFRVADGNSEHCFVHLQVKIGAGRSDEEKQSAGKAFFDTLTNHLQPVFEQRGMGISFELGELPAVKFNQNNLHERLKQS